MSLFLMLIEHYRRNVLCHHCIVKEILYHQKVSYQLHVITHICIIILHHHLHDNTHSYHLFCIIKKYFVLITTTHFCVIIFLNRPKVLCHLYDNTLLYHYFF